MKMKKKRLLRLLLSLVMVLALMVGFAPGMGMTAWADTALPADGSDAGNGLRYYVGYAMGQQGGNYETGGDDKGGASLFDKNPNTKACIGFVGSYSVEFSYASAIIPHNYYFRTGDDTSTQTKRNPSAWKLEGKNTDNTWTVLDEKSGQTYTTANNTEVKFGISNNTAYQTFRLTITANNSSGLDEWPIGGKPSFQLTEFYMSGTIAPASSVASVTSGGTTTNYTDFASAVTAWNSAASGATLTLLADVTMANTINVSGTKILDLNGYGIKKTGSGRVLMVTNGANMTLHDSNATRTDTGANRPDGVSGGYITGGNTRNESGSCVRVESGSAFNMYGGTITGNTLENGGGAVLVIGGNFNMYGGIITGNKGDNNCGGVWVHSKKGSTFNMYCGTITDNSLYDVNAQGVMTTSSNATIGDFDYSEYVAVTFDANGGTGSMPLQKVRKNTDTTIFANVNCSASGISDPAFSREGYDFAGWNTQADGEGTNYTAGTSTINISEATTLYAHWTAHVASVTSGGTPTKYTTISAALDAWTNGATLTLLSDVTISSTIKVSGTKTLDLNGHGITMTGSDRVINVGGASLTLNDSAPNAPHKYTIQNPKSNGAGLAVVDDANGTQTFTGGYITGGNTKENERGGGVVVNGGSLTMNGGTIIGNNAALHGGGIALVASGDKFVMNGGALIGNTGKYGGGLSMILASSGTINGGKIQYNCTSSNGGGIHTDGAGQRVSLTVTGGAITNNYCGGSTESGGGVLVSGTTFNLSGSVEIKDNLRKTGADNLCLIAGKTVIVADTLSNSTPIGVTMKTPGEFTSGTNTNYNDLTKFTSDNTSYVVRKNEDGQLYLRTAVTATYKVVNGTWSDGTTADKTETVASGSTPASVPTGMKASEGYKGGAWDTNPADATITKATTFTYTFEAKTAAVVTTAPEAKALTSNGSVRELVTPGQASGGNMYYVLGTDTTTAPTDGWTTSIPTATEAGTYYVWYKVVGDADHLDVDPACVTVTIVEPSSSVDLTLGDDTTNVAVTGLDALAEESKEAGKTVVVTMTVDKKDKTEVEAADSAAIETAAEGMRLEYIDISLTKTVDGTESPLTDTSTVLEIIVPYDFSKKMQTTVKVYRYHGTSATALTEATTKADGTYRLDRDNNLVYIYANQFSTYAIGFTPTYTVSGTLDFGSFTGTVSFSLTGNGVTKTASSTVTNGSGSYSFTGVPAGTYDVTASWSKGGKAHTLMFTVTVPAGTP